MPVVSQDETGSQRKSDYFFSVAGNLLYDPSTIKTEGAENTLRILRLEANKLRHILSLGGGVSADNMRMTDRPNDLKFSCNNIITNLSPEYLKIEELEAILISLERIADTLVPGWDYGCMEVEEFMSLSSILFNCAEIVSSHISTHAELDKILHLQRFSMSRDIAFSRCVLCICLVLSKKSLISGVEYLAEIDNLVYEISCIKEPIKALTLYHCVSTRLVSEQSIGKGMSDTTIESLMVIFSLCNGMLIRFSYRVQSFGVKFNDMVCFDHLINIVTRPLELIASLKVSTESYLVDVIPFLSQNIIACGNEIVQLHLINFLLEKFSVSQHHIPSFASHLLPCVQRLQDSIDAASVYSIIIDRMLESECQSLIHFDELWTAITKLFDEKLCHNFDHNSNNDANQIKTSEVLNRLCTPIITFHLRRRPFSSDRLNLILAYLLCRLPTQNIESIGILISKMIPSVLIHFNDLYDLEKFLSVEACRILMDRIIVEDGMVEDSPMLEFVIASLAIADHEEISTVDLEKLNEYILYWESMSNRLFKRPVLETNLISLLDRLMMKTPKEPFIVPLVLFCRQILQDKVSVNNLQSLIRNLIQFIKGVQIKPSITSFMINDDLIRQRLELFYFDSMTLEQTNLLFAIGEDDLYATISEIMAVYEGQVTDQNTQAKILSRILQELSLRCLNDDSPISSIDLTYLVQHIMLLSRRIVTISIKSDVLLDCGKFICEALKYHKFDESIMEEIATCLVTVSEINRLVSATRILIDTLKKQGPNFLIGRVVQNMIDRINKLNDCEVDVTDLEETWSKISHLSLPVYEVDSVTVVISDSDNEFDSNLVESSSENLDCLPLHVGVEEIENNFKDFNGHIDGDNESIINGSLDSTDRSQADVVSIDEENEDSMTPFHTFCPEIDGFKFL